MMVSTGSTTEVRRVVIVGGGIGGVSTAAALRSGGFLGEVTLVDSGELPYDRPPLSKDYLAGTCEADKLALQPPHWYDDNSVRLINKTTVVAIRPGEGAVELTDGSALSADRVVLATGGHAARPPIPGADSPSAHVLRTAADADRLRKTLLPGARVLIVGGGLIGAEVASTARGLGCEVSLADPVSPPLAQAVGTEVATWLHDLHTRQGITVLRAGVQELRPTAGGTEAHLSGDDVPRVFDAVLLGVGMVPETALARNAGLETDRGIVVDERQNTSNPAVLAVGDSTRRRLNGVLQQRAEHWEAAQYDGARAAATILDAPAPTPTASWFWSDRHGLHVEAVGRITDAAETAVRGTIGDPPFAVFGLRDGVVVGAAAVDEPTAVRAARRLIDRRIPVDAARLADLGTDLRRLLRG
jgi:3-phenylpropionate/trans-cinnamate dioxygenase ferredoxin reductase subunit